MAQFTLGQCYSGGIGAEKNMATAAKWFGMGADQGHADAQFKLACLYEDGNGVQKNTGRAVEWLNKAAEQGYFQAQQRLDNLVGKNIEREQDGSGDAWVLMPSENGKVLEDGVAFENLSAKEWHCATRGSLGWRSGVHTWTVTLDKRAANISVGIARKNIDFQNVSRNDTKRYDMYGGYGYALDPSNDEYVCFSEVESPRALQDGDEVSLCLDLEKRSLTFGLKKKWNAEPTFTDIPKGEWFPYFALEKKGARFSVTRWTSGPGK